MSDTIQNLPRVGTRWTDKTVTIKVWPEVICKQDGETTSYIPRMYSLPQALEDVDPKDLERFTQHGITRSTITAFDPAKETFTLVPTSSPVKMEAGALADMMLHNYTTTLRTSMTTRPRVFSSKKYKIEKVGYLEFKDQLEDDQGILDGIESLAFSRSDHAKYTFIYCGATVTSNMSNSVILKHNPRCGVPVFDKTVTVKLYPEFISRNNGTETIILPRLFSIVQDEQTADPWDLGHFRQLGATICDHLPQMDYDEDTGKFWILLTDEMNPSSLMPIRKSLESGQVRQRMIAVFGERLRKAKTHDDFWAREYNLELAEKQEFVKHTEKNPAIVFWNLQRGNFTDPSYTTNTYLFSGIRVTDQEIMDRVQSARRSA